MFWGLRLLAIGALLALAGCGSSSNTDSQAERATATATPTAAAATPSPDAASVQVQDDGRRESEQEDSSESQDAAQEGSTEPRDAELGERYYRLCWGDATSKPVSETQRTELYAICEKARSGVPEDIVAAYRDVCYTANDMSNAPASSAHEYEIGHCDSYIESVESDLGLD